MVSKPWTIQEKTTFSVFVGVNACPDAFIATGAFVEVDQHQALALHKPKRFGPFGKLCVCGGASRLRFGQFVIFGPKGYLFDDFKTCGRGLLDNFLKDIFWNSEQMDQRFILAPFRGANLMGLPGIAMDISDT